MAWYDIFLPSAFSFGSGATEEAPAVASSPFGDGITVGSNRYLCKWDPVYPLAKCASASYAQGLANAMMGALYITVPPAEPRWYTAGGASPSGVTATGRTGPETVFGPGGRIEATAPERRFPWGWVAGFGALALVVGAVVMKGKKRRR